MSPILHSLAVRVPERTAASRMSPVEGFDDTGLEAVFGVRILPFDQRRSSGVVASDTKTSSRIPGGVDLST